MGIENLFQIDNTKPVHLVISRGGVNFHHSSTSRNIVKILFGLVKSEPNIITSIFSPGKILISLKIK